MRSPRRIVPCFPLVNFIAYPMFRSDSLFLFKGRNLNRMLVKSLTITVQVPAVVAVMALPQIMGVISEAETD